MHSVSEICECDGELASTQQHRSHSTNFNVSADTEGMPYYLSKHAHCCLADQHYVFLDLRRNRYLCLGRAHTNAIKSILKDRHCIDQSSLESDAVVQALLQSGLLVENEAYGKLPEPPRVDAPATSLIVSSDRPRPGLAPAYIWDFFAAAATASKDLRLRSIACTVRAVENRRSTHTTDATAVDNDVLIDLFEIFQTLRPFYPRPYLCLFDSLALLHFLARYGTYPQWVYGVKLEPFAAHCWVQAGEIVVNDTIDNVRDYTPIMSV